MKKIIAAVAVAIALTVGGLYFAGIIHIGGSKPKADVAAEHKVEAPPVYFALDPPFVVNFTHRGTLRYLQVSIELMYHDPALLTKVKEHMPAIRNDLILLFSNQDYELLSSAAGKETLRHQILAAINKVIGVGGDSHAATAEVTAPSAPAAETAAAGEQSALGEVYFTNFVMQ